MGQRDDEIRQNSGDMGIYRIANKAGKMMRINPAMGKRISDLMEQQGISQSELARRIGVTRATMSRYASGKAAPRGSNMDRLAQELHTTTDYLIGHDTDAEKDAKKEYHRAVRDAKKEYHRVMHAVARNARLWTKEERLALIGAIFDDKE